MKNMKFSSRGKKQITEVSAPKPKSLSRRKYLLTMSALVLSGCAENSTLNNVIDMLKLTTKGLFPTGSTDDGPASKITREQVSSIPYASMMAKVGNQPSSFVVLGKIVKNQYSWFTSDYETLITQGGRIVRTIGLSHNLKYSSSSDRDPLSSPGPKNWNAAVYRRIIDLEPQNVFGALVHSTFRKVRDETITILSLTYDTEVISETCVSESMDWKFENLYWVEKATGFPWKSRQHFNPKLPPLEIEILKPPRADLR